MQSITSKNAQDHFGRLLDEVQREPVTITRHDRPVAVVVSRQRFEELEALEDAIWAARARAAAQSGSVGVEATAEFIARTLNAEA